MRTGPTARSKYDDGQDYHWAEYRRGSVYASHARHVRTTITEHYVLDVGGGDGLIAALLTRKGCQVEVLDTNALAISLARRHGLVANVGSAYHLTGDYDAIYSGDMLEHLRWPGWALWQFATVAPVCYIATPPRRPEGLHDAAHVREWSPAELTRLLARWGWDEVWQTVAHGRILGKYRRKAWWRRCLSVLCPSV